MPTARRTELPTRSTVILRSNVPGSGIKDIFLFIYNSIADTDRYDEREFLATDCDDGEGETYEVEPNPLTESLALRLIAFPIRTPAYETIIHVVRDNTKSYRH